MALCATTALAAAVPRLCVRGARGRFGGFGPVPCVVSLSFPPSCPTCSALRVAGRPVRVSLTLARWYAIPRGLCVPRARSGCPSGRPRVIRAPPRVLPRSLAPPGVLGGGRSGPGSPLTLLWVVGVAVGRPRGGCLGASGVGRSPTPDCSPSGRATGAGVGRPGSDALPPPSARPLGGLPGPMWGVESQALSRPRLPALWAGCWGRCGASRVGGSPTPDCPASRRAAGAGVGRPGSGALPPPTARPLGGVLGPVWESGVERSPTPDCPPSGRATGAGVGRPGWDAVPPPSARPLGGLLGPVPGVRGGALSHPRLPVLWAGCRGRCGASRVGRSPTPDCRPSGRAAGAGVGRPGSDALPSPTARPLGGLPGPVWGVQGRTLSHPPLSALWAGCRGRCGASGVGRSPTPDCSPSGRAAGAGVGSPGSGALPPPTARPLGGLPGPVWGVRGLTPSQPRLPALWAGCRGRRGASAVGRSPTPDCSPSGRAAGAGVGRPGSGALPSPTARPLGGLPELVWGFRGRTLSRPRLPALWAGFRGWCGASGVGRSPTPDCSPSGRAAEAGVGRPGSDTLPAPTARTLGGLPGPMWGVRGGLLSHPRLPALWAGCRGRCGASGVGRSPTPNCSPSGRAAGAGVGHPGSDALPPPTARLLGGLLGRCGASGVWRSPTPDCSPSGRAAGAGVGRPGSDTLPAPTARTLGGLPGPMWGVRGGLLSHPRLPALWAGCRGRCGTSGVGRSPTPNCSPSGRAAGAGVESIYAICMESIYLWIASLFLNFWVREVKRAQRRGTILKTDETVATATPHSKGRFPCSPAIAQTARRRISTP